MTQRSLTKLDELIAIADTGLRTVFGHPASERPNPAMNLKDEITDTNTRELAGRLMRVNHTGEVCAQALYQGQALTARSHKVREELAQSAREENDHLAWCEQRLDQLGTHKSRLNPLWYGGSFIIGVVSGLLGDRVNLGFLAETERQVVQHLDGHLQRLPTQDHVSRAIIQQMKLDEGKHATHALHA
ncbi:MAG: 2-polyprenyl-3-methyl-6-methoxy-1,4-benzoquinone monooxygenase, partial [Saprospiraceae bacterium]|nr:2-polyprenyl-3-methyl-6-methoxy-1,4-benzoquinone monooxygenase [Saprospiraceae bacterium]